MGAMFTAGIAISITDTPTTKLKLMPLVSLDHWLG